ncbi:TIGR03620 family F420-dependent LLM class oxidoreductase [Nocardia arthritidis]|uniref:TIGR03620 family F420-dependent LLM class oxidoreductase n=1 Tax=Nocardia arthritidis TaxID=228602 RepID=A0A6G9Y6P3_9NOCA|nr:TIGR03620 family F420-dependent LLM class oxidoreductase [Nocardia arthritidis]QIS08723.1 TIGR03620 family F420-dependent LLM class oxidoreductase [Nocardia arthritidis]
MNPSAGELGAIRKRLGSFGVWFAPMTLLATPVAVQREQFARIEELGFGSLWSGEPPADSPMGGREAFAEHGLMLAATSRMVVGIGVANITRRDPIAMHSGAATLAEAYPGRFILGIGGQIGRRPLAQLGEYLDGMDAAAERVLPEIAYPRVLAALGPKAHEIAAQRFQGVHPFMQPVEHTANARGLLGAEGLLIPHQFLLLDSVADSARGAIRSLFGGGRGLLNGFYANNFRRLGYTDADLGGDLSDRFVDAVLAWGDPQAVADRLRDHLRAGADHVLLHPISHDLAGAVDQLELLAAHL